MGADVRQSTHSYLEHYKKMTNCLELKGMLIYPSVGTNISLQYELLGTKFSVHSVDLNRPWVEIHENLLSIISGCDFH